jgi:hypothetical protein
MLLQHCKHESRYFCIEHHAEVIQDRLRQDKTFDKDCQYSIGVTVSSQKLITSKRVSKCHRARLQAFENIRLLQS